MSSTVKKEVISWVKTILLAMVLAGAVNSFLIVNAEVPTGSMENTIMTDDRILAMRTAYWFDEPQAGDVAIFRYPDDPTGRTLYVKRIIGKEGDVVQVQDGVVTVNGEALEEDYALEPISKRIDFTEPVVVPEGCVFVLGDNRNASTDSRDDRIGCVDVRYIMGKAHFIILPGEDPDMKYGREWRRFGSLE